MRCRLYKASALMIRKEWWPGIWQKYHVWALFYRVQPKDSSLANILSDLLIFDKLRISC